MKLVLKFSVVYFSVLALNILAMTQVYANMTITQKLFKPVIQYQCGVELNESKLWKVSTYFMTEPNRMQLQKEVCECVSINALNDISTQDLLKATISEETKNAVAKQAALNSIKACILESKQ